MLHQVVTTVSLDSFRQRSAGKKVVLLYPWTNYRNLFLAHFLSNTEEGLLYYRIPHDQTNLSDWLIGLVDGLNDILDGFGENLQQTLTENNPTALGEALAADLGAFQKQSGKETVLYIDELDRVSINNDFVEFCRALVNALPQHTQIALSSRLLTYRPWYDMVAQGDALVMGTENRKNDLMFTIEDPPKPQLEVYALGRGYALVNGQEITNWDGALPRNLFFFFMDNPLVTRDEIFETFWPDLSVKEATNVFHVTKRKISERIGMKVHEPGSYELTQYTSGFYIPSTKVVRHYDAVDFREAIERALIASNEREEENLYRRAIDLYKAAYLQTINMHWVEERRGSLRELYSQALIGMGRINKLRHDNERALGFFTRALRETPGREDIHREVMSLYITLGMHEDARAQYQHLEKMLKSELSIKPSRETQELYEMIKA
jgi:DNA-binding SARP family transcriptional activator